MEEVNPDAALDQPKHSRYSLKTLIILLTAIVGILLIGTLVLYSTSGILPFGSGSLERATRPTAVPHGLLLLSLAIPQSTSSVSTVIRPAAYDFSRSDGVFFTVGKIAGKTITSTEQYRFSSDGQWGVFLGQGVLADSTSTREAAQVYRVDVSKAEDIDAVVAALQEANAITDDTDYKRAPAISTVGDVLYMVMPRSAPPGDTPEASNVAYVPLNGEARTLVSGSYPQWVDANRFIFLKSDGIYLYSIDTGASKRIWSIKDGGITADSMLRLSDDKSVIAWSIPQHGVVTILRVANWDSPKIQFVGTVPVVGAWPVVAHDALAFVVLAQAPAVNATSKPTLQINVYDIASMQLIYSIPLPAADPNLTSITDWRL